MRRGGSGAEEFRHHQMMMTHGGRARAGQRIVPLPASAVRLPMIHKHGLGTLRDRALCRLRVLGEPTSRTLLQVKRWGQLPRSGWREDRRRQADVHVHSDVIGQARQTGFFSTVRFVRKESRFGTGAGDGG